MQKTNIPYLSHSWNPLQDKRKGKTGRGYHCTKCSPGCLHCWAEGVNMRFGNKLPFDGRPAEFEIMEKELEAPLKRRKPARIGVQFMGDLFYDNLEDDITYQNVWEDVWDIFTTMVEANWHTYLVLTKRINNAKHFYDKWILDPRALKHIHLGVSVCTQAEADEKIPQLLQIPAAVRYISYEPALGPLILANEIWAGQDHTVTRMNGIDWVIAGCESGPGRRPANIHWFRDLRDQCQAANVPYFLKQMEQPYGGKIVSMPHLDFKVWDQLPKIA